MSEPFLSAEDQALIRRQKYSGLNNDEWATFMHAVDRFRLDPFANQIYAVQRNQKDPSGNYVKVMSIQTGIDGFRLIADRTGQYAGSDDAVYDSEAQPKRATVSVWKMVAGQRCPFTASARWDQYYPGDKQGMMWKKMPHLMLGKCAEALALRKAFPAELAGLYTADEMAQADREPADAPPKTEPPRKSSFGSPPKPPEQPAPPPQFAWGKATSAERKAYVIKRIAEVSMQAGNPQEAMEALKAMSMKLKGGDFSQEDMDAVAQAFVNAENEINQQAGSGA